MALLLLTACSNTDNDLKPFKDQYIAYGDRLDECHEIAKSNDKAFPISKWYQALDNNQKINVLLYLSKVNSDKCSQVERDKLNILAESLPIEARNQYLQFGAGEPLEVDHYLDGLDKAKVTELERYYPYPFIMSFEAKRQGLN